MLDREYQTMRRVEDDYWWYRVLRTMTCGEVSRCVSGLDTARILDAGCGTGGMMEVLKRRNSSWILQGFDVSPLAVEHTRKRGFVSSFEASADSVPLNSESQDVIVSLDVLYHENVNPEGAMAEFGRLLRPDGFLIMNLPGFECLRGQHDVAVRNARRYTPRQVRDLHSRHGLALERVFCWNVWLFLPVLLWRRASKVLASAVSKVDAKSDLVPPPPLVNRLLTGVGLFEARLCRSVSCPVGTSVFSIAKKSAGR
jgi:SAM-dependent methyltransferase